MNSFFSSDWKQRPDDLWPRVDNKWQAIQSGAACKMFFSWCQACEDVILYLVPCCLICLHSACYFYADWEPVLPRSLLDPFGFWQISIAKFSIPQYLVGGFKQFLFSHNIWGCHPSQLTNSIIFKMCTLHHQAVQRMARFQMRNLMQIHPSKNSQPSDALSRYEVFFGLRMVSGNM